jgi:hypothetical protein
MVSTEDPIMQEYVILLKTVIHGHFCQKWGCIAIGHRLEAHLPYPTYLTKKWSPPGIQ